ncbi:MarR family transcriptional regulator [Blastococcus sp. TML/M2B]|uniref:MarR family winged helix-turn-helix transcriptional regulator n=1 Tax=unclassified Blastococcus TaxID=2619396 RepID=UPI00190E31BE|nr:MULTISPECIES: MarR family transcriptional regulator [unclassified Blastococcus]MBN1094395.1 MarR family transcriptional regulator [Blastococcus sp. TML/M2B]MBN1095355.1 MarR family transcriptional regulator [Blastococcus sp. TML/C7B]
MAEDATGELLLQVARAQRRRWREALAPWDLSPHQARALGVVVERGGVRPSDLAEALHIAPRSATEVADGLQERGLVERTRDPGDRRAVVLRPTDEGRRIRAEVARARAADTEALLSRLTPDERATLTRLLTALLD